MTYLQIPVLPYAQVHFRSLPSDVLLRWDGEQTLRASFFNSLKVRPRMGRRGPFFVHIEVQHQNARQVQRLDVLCLCNGMCSQEAAYICQGSAGNVMGMASEAQDDMWRAVIQVRSAKAVHGDRPRLPLEHLPLSSRCIQALHVQDEMPLLLMLSVCIDLRHS